MLQDAKIAIGAGILIGAGALIYLATRAKAEPPPGAEFQYVSLLGLRLEDRTDGWFPIDVDIQNIGEQAGNCQVTLHERGNVAGRWSGWTRRTSDSIYIEPAQVVTVTLLGTVPDVGVSKQYMFKGDAGVILEPPTPLEYLCGYCYELYGYYSDFATQEELDAHIIAEHP